jgi:hypothetical protein
MVASRGQSTPTATRRLLQKEQDVQSFGDDWIRAEPGGVHLEGGAGLGARSPVGDLLYAMTPAPKPARRREVKTTSYL